MNYKSVHYTMIDENGDRSSESLITADNMFYIMGSTWNFKLADCLAAGYAPILDSDRQYENGEGVVEIEPGNIIKNDDGSFTQEWFEGEVPLEEKRARFMERKRLNLLSLTDWTQTLDSPLSDDERAEYAAYRQLLRDLPETIDWETIQGEGDVNWPLEPGLTKPTPEEVSAQNPNVARDPETGEPL